MARAIRAADAPAIDGDLSDKVWKEAPWHTDFIQRRPVDGAPATLKTWFAAAFDDENIYFAVRCEADGRESIITRLTRRDRGGDFDVVSIVISPRGDGRTGYSFNVNPDGVQQDSAWHDDGKGDKSWDAVWRAETRIEDREWTAEVAIPIDQLRFPAGRERWGLQIMRWISSRQEGVVFNPIPIDKSGWISAAGVLEGVDEIEPKQPVVLIPESYFSYRSSTSGFGGRGADGLAFGAGGYAKTGLGPDIVLDVAVNPDFGQVEVDQAVLNLSAYETRFPEKRPFFLEGAGMFSTPIQLFYSRRLGAPPPDPGLGDTEVVRRGPTATPILSAAKVTGRSSGGLSVGVIDAALLPTEFVIEDEATGIREYRDGSSWTNASVLRLNTEPTGSSTFGLMATALNPADNNGSYTGGVDWNLLDANKEYSFRGQIAGSLRDDEILGREESHGAGVWARLAREGGEHLRLRASYSLFTDGFDPNDLGYLRRDDLQSYSLFVQFRQADKIGPFAQLYAGVTPYGSFDTDGLDLGQNCRAYFQAKWLSDWVTEIGAFGGLRHFDDREARGGPPLKLPASGGGWIWIRAAQRKILGGHLNLQVHTEPHGFSAGADLTLSLRLSRLELELSPGYERTEGELAYVATLDEGNPAETTIIGRLDLDELDLGLRGTYVILRNLTVQVLGQMLLARADYGHYQLLLPDSSTEPEEFSDDDADFVRTDLRLQALIRWEYLPGSALYAVYTHFGFVDLYGSGHTLRRGIEEITNEEREQLFMVKVSHRF